VFYSLVGYDFLDVYKIKLLKGRDFSPRFGTDAKEAVIINETALKLTGWEEPIGKTVTIRGRKIIGVIQDFHHSSLHEEIRPMIFLLGTDKYDYVSARIKPGRISETITFLEYTIQKFSSNFAFEYYFQDDHFNKKYKNDRRFGKAFGYFSFLSIFIGCLGLFGLVSYSIEQRVKEIGIRKVLGAAESNIIFLLSKEFVKWVILANLFAWPAAYIAMNKWLQNFSYRIGIGIEVFIFSAALALLIALITISYQSVKAALANPVDALKYE
jgi:putative ABC transport system permease protein